MSLLKMDLRLKSFNSIEGEEEGVFEAYANVKNVIDKARDCTVNGCFANTIESAINSGRMPKMLLQHVPADVCGVWLEMREDDKGLWVKGKLAVNTVIGRETYELLKIGALDSLSIGYLVKKEYYDGVRRINFLQDVDVREISIVTFPCNEDSRIESVKSEDIQSALAGAIENTPKDEIPAGLIKRLDTLVLSFQAK